MIFPYDGLFLHEMTKDISWDRFIYGQCSLYSFYPTFSDFIRPYLFLLQFEVNVIGLKHIYDKNKFILSYVKVVELTKYGVYYGVFEFILKNVIENLTLTYDISEILLGASSLYGYKEAYEKNGMFVLQGLTEEPSHFNCFLFTYAILIILGNKILKDYPNYTAMIKYNNISAIVAVFLLIVSGGFSAVWFLLMLVFCYIIVNRKTSDINLVNFIRKRIVAFLYTICLGTVVVLILFQNDYFYRRLQDAFFIVDYIIDADNLLGVASIMGSDEGSGSTFARFISIYVGMDIFFDRPLFGLGIDMQYVHSFTVSFLTNIGILGMYSIYKLLACTGDDKRHYDKLLLFIIFIIGGMPLNIFPIGFSMHWLLLFEITGLYVNGKVS